MHLVARSYEHGSCSTGRVNRALDILYASMLLNIFNLTHRAAEKHDSCYNLELEVDESL